MSGRILFPWQRERQGRVFISYRRDDTQWVAGRLSDSLSNYFGDNRVFRDIEGIGGGADFSEVIHGTLGSADAAVILIGDKWLTASDEQGRRRLDNPDDWVVKEVAAILQADIPVFPVLVEGTQMPRADELPENIRTLARSNAVSLSDKRWIGDVSRLARLVSLDIPSATERKLGGLNLMISLALLVSVLTTLVIMVWNLGPQIQQLYSGEKCPFWYWPSGVECSRSPGGSANSSALKSPLSLMQSGITFMAIVPCSVLLFVFSRMVEKSRRRYFLGAAWVGAIGSLMSFVLLAPISGPYEPISMFFGSTLTVLVMFALMNLSGFRPK